MLTCGVGRFRSPHHCYAGLHSSCSAPTLHAIKPLRHPSYSLTGTLNPGSLLTWGLAIFDERGRPLKIGMRVGGRYAGEPKSMSRRGIILEGYEPDHPEPYLTNAGRFPLVLMDHQPDMDQWIADHVSR